jgi:hypothetical protein
MKNVVAWSEHVAFAIVDVNFIVTDYAVQSRSFTWPVLAHRCTSRIFCPRTEPRSVAPTPTISSHTVEGGRRITVQQWHELDFGCCRASRIICQSRKKSRRNRPTVVEFRRQESFQEMSIGVSVRCKNQILLVTKLTKGLPLRYHESSAIFALCEENGCLEANP